MQAPTQDANPFRLVTYDEAALLMSVSVGHLKRLVKEGRVPVVHYLGPQSPRIPWWIIVQQISRDFGVEVQLSPNVPVELLRH